MVQDAAELRQYGVALLGSVTCPRKTISAAYLFMATWWLACLKSRLYTCLYTTLFTFLFVAHVYAPMSQACPFLVIVYNGLCMKTFETFSCITLRDGSQAMNVHPEVTCWDGGEHTIMVVVSVVCIVVYAGPWPRLPWLHVAILSSSVRPSLGIAPKGIGSCLGGRQVRSRHPSDDARCDDLCTSKRQVQGSRRTLFQRIGPFLFSDIDRLPFSMVVWHSSPRLLGNDPPTAYCSKQLTATSGTLHQPTLSFIFTLFSSYC